jgi:hypothetical protein
MTGSTIPCRIINDTEEIENRPAVTAELEMDVPNALRCRLGPWCDLEECDGQVRVAVRLKDHFLRPAEGVTGLREGSCNLAKADSGVFSSNGYPCNSRHKRSSYCA